MTQRERKLLVGAGSVLGGIVLLVVFYKMLLGPLFQNKDTLAGLQEEYQDKAVLLRQRRADRQEFRRLFALSLPADPDPRRREYELARTEYDQYLRDLVRASGLKAGRVDDVRIATTPRVGPPGTLVKKPLFTPLVFRVEGRGDLAQVVDLLRRFYETPLLHRVQAISVHPAESVTKKNSTSRELVVAVTVEGLLLQGAEKRTYLMPTNRQLLAVNEVMALRRGPVGLPLLPLVIDTTGLIKPQPLVSLPYSAGEYGRIARKNIFFAPTPLPPPPQEEKTRDYPDENINEDIRLTSIVHGGDRWEAFFYDVFNNVNTRVRAKDLRAFFGPRQAMTRAFRNIPIYDSEGERKSAVVSRIDERDIYFWYDGDYYGIHVGETLAETFKRGPLSSSQVADLGLPPEPEKEDSD